MSGMIVDQDNTVNSQEAGIVGNDAQLRQWARDNLGEHEHQASYEVGGIDRLRIKYENHYKAKSERDNKGLIDSERKRMDATSILSRNSQVRTSLLSSSAQRKSADSSKRLSRGKESGDVSNQSILATKGKQYKGGFYSAS